MLFLANLSGCQAIMPSASPCYILFNISPNTVRPGSLAVLASQREATKIKLKNNFLQKIQIVQKKVF